MGRKVWKCHSCGTLNSTTTVFCKCGHQFNSWMDTIGDEVDERGRHHNIEFAHGKFQKGYRR